MPIPGLDSAIGLGMGLALEGHNDRRQMEQQRRLQGLQIQGQQQMVDYNYMKQLQMWKDTGYEAQMKQMKEAGLNPALMYKQGGSGGMTIGTPTGNVQGGSAPQGGMEVLNMLMAKTQMELMQAQTEKTKAETGAVAPTIQKTQQETTNLKTQNALQELERGFQEATFKNRESIINLSLSQLIEEVQIIENNREISDATKNDQIKQIIETAKNTVQDGLYKRAQTAKTWKEKESIDKQIRAIDQQININSIDEQMAKDGVNPKAGTMLKTGYNLLTLLKNLIGL